MAKKSKDEQPKPEFVTLNIGEVKITFFGRHGGPLARGDVGRVCDFRIEGPGIDPERVRSVKIPKLDYADPKALTITVKMYPYAIEMTDLKFGKTAEQVDLKRFGDPR
jgi:hypothetical protein